MLFHSTLRKELARTFGATLVVLITVVMSMMLIRTLGQATRGSVNPQDIMMVMGYSVLGHLPTILTLSLFVSITATLGRMYRDSEMVIWFGAGRGLASFLGPLLRFAWPILLVIALLALVVWPWSNQQTQDMKDRYEKRGDIERVTPGQFQENASGSRVFFIEKSDNPAASGRNVFISATERGKQAVTSARSGRIDTIKDERFLLLNKGQRLEQDVGQSALKISEFEEYGTKVGSNVDVSGDNAPVKSIDSRALYQKPTPLGQAELAWRIGLALAACNFVVLALAMSSFNPRAGRGGNLMLAMLAFVVYYNLLNLGHGWISGGKASWLRYLLMLHGGVLCVSVLWLALRHYHWSWRNLLPRPISLTAPAA